MESPLWELKPEPVSPQHIYEDAWLFDDASTATDLTAIKFQSVGVKHEEESLGDGFGESKAEVYSKLLDDLDQLDQLEDFIKEEPFSNWLEEKVELPIFEDIRIEPARGYPTLQRFKHEDLKPISHSFNLNHVVQPSIQPLLQHVQPLQPVQQQQQDTNMLLQEFETVFGAVEMTHGQLTPPQSPPLSPPCSQNPQPQQNPQPVVLTPLTPISFVAQRIPLSIPVSLQSPLQLPVYYQQQPPATPQPDVAHELAVVEELVRSRAENLVNDSWDQPAPSSPSSSSSSGFSEYSSDPEWIPDSVQSTSAAASNELVERSARGRKRAGKPYARIGTEDKKSRKKEQNKNAATRYRMKKKAEVEEILTEERQLMDTKGELNAQVSDLQREIKCLKGLMRDLFKAKGLIQ